MKKLLIIFALLVGCFSYGQNVIGNAFSIKSLTSTQRDALNVTGRYPIIYNSTTSQYERYNGSAWVRLTDAVTSADITDGAIDILDTDSGIQTSLGLADTSIQTELNDLSTVTWANIPDANVPASAVTQHASAIISAVPSNTITAEKLQYSTETEGEVIKINGGFSTWGFVESENILDGSIDILDTDAGIQTSLGLADSAIQSISSGSIGATELASTTVTPGSYTNTDLTVDADGRITAASTVKSVLV